MDAQEIKNIAKAASDWWVAQLSPVPGSDIGDDSANGAMILVLRIMAAQPVTESALIDFGMNLYEVIQEAQERNEEYISFGVDYHPEGLLYDALERCKDAHALISQMPLKTRMSISEGKVEAARGYGANWIQIYPVIESESEGR